MKVLLSLVLVLLPVRGWAQVDDQVQRLVQEAVDRNPDLARAKALVEAEKERIPQAGALPDPSLSLGIQNDGFKKIEVGQMETSFYQVMVTQPLPWPGKRGLRSDIATFGSQAVAETMNRTRLTLEADVRRAYFALLLVRSQLRLLEDQALFLQQAEATVKARYEVGQGAQADLLRAQLERTRLAQTRLGLQSAERSARAVLNRLRARSPEAPLATPGTLEQVPEPGPIQVEQALQEAAAHSPELKAANIGSRQAEKGVALARLDLRPDFGVSAGLMPRGGLDPMWTANVSISLPLWRRQKQSRAVAEQEQRRQASGSEVASLTNLLAQRIQERAAAMDAALGTIRLYRSGLLVQSEAAFRATLAQFEVGRAPFLSVLEALNGWIADQSGLLQTQVGAQSIAIAQAEFDLAAPPAFGTTLGSAAMGSQGGGSASSPGSAKGGSAKGSDSEASSMKTM